MILRQATIRYVATVLNFFIFAACCTYAADDSEGTRQRININAFWKYQQGDVSGAQAADFDDAEWQSTGLPHSFSIPYFLSPDFYVGYGWYRKHLQLPESIAGKRVSLEFDGVFQEAELFVNGTRVGEHKGGYTGFSMDVTAAARPGDNVVAVRVNNVWNPRLAPRAGEHVFSGGIYRNVFLVVTEALHVDWYGTFVTTPEVSAEIAAVNVKTDVVNASGRQKSVTVRQQIVDPDGNITAEFSATQSIAAGATAAFDMSSPPLKNPQLWHPERPLLYAVKTTVLEVDRVADEYTTPFGIRTFEWTADKGFFLNGKRLYLRGANLHQDQAGWGDAMTDASIERDLKLMKQAGFNFIRGSHYPHAPKFSEMCDRLGLLFWSENAFWCTAMGRQPEGYWNGSGYPTRASDQPEFEASVKQQLAEMIRIHRNHPSIIAWSMCNEPFFSAGSTMARVRTFLRELVELTHTLDPTRPAALGGVQRPTDQNRIDKIGDIAGYNGDGARIAAFQNPGIPNMVSEYGSTNTDRPGMYDPGWGDLARDRGEPVHEWRAGQALWCGFDHGSIFPRFGKMGIVDYFRIPKRSWYWYRNEYTNTPPPDRPQAATPAGLRLESDKIKNIRTDGTDDAWLLVTVLDADGKPTSNSPPVELAIAKGPGEFPTGPSISFANDSDIRILDGQAAINVRSYYAGDAVIRAASPGLASAEITLRFVGSAPFREGAAAGVPPRPYVRFVRQGQPSGFQTFGRNSPTFPTSSLDGHAAAAAADGDPQTYWQPADNDPAPAWTVDVERFIMISRIRITLAKAAANRLQIDVSDDQKEWRPLTDKAINDKSAAMIDVAAPANATGRFVRLRFQGSPTGVPIQLCEIECIGTLRN
jgi:beta-galactosidase